MCQVRIPQGSLKDVYGQSLSQDVQVAYHVTRAMQSLSSLHQRMEMFDPLPLLRMDPAHVAPSPAGTAMPPGQVVLLSKDLPEAVRIAVPLFTAVSTNLTKLRVAVWRMTPRADFRAFRAWENDGLLRQKGEDGPLTGPTGCGVKLVDAIAEVGGAPDEATTTDIDLRPFLPGGSMGHLLVLVEPVPADYNASEWRWRPVHYSWIQVSHLAADFFSVDSAGAHVLTTHIGDGSPVQGARVYTLRAGKPAGATDSHGLCHLPPESLREEAVATTGLFGARAPQYSASRYASARSEDVVVAVGADELLLTDVSWSKCLVSDKQARIFTFDDRKLYKPKETVTIKGVVRVLTPTEGGKAIALAMPGPALKGSWRAFDPRGQQLAEGKVLDVTEYGGFKIAFPLPDNANTGDARVQFDVVSGDGWKATSVHAFQIQEFRRPECKVSAALRSKASIVAGTVGVVGVSAKYYAGNVGLAGATATWAVRQEAGSFVPPSWSGEGFGWSGRDGGRWGAFEEPPKFVGRWDHTAVTDGAGEHLLAVECAPGPATKHPTRVQLEATVVDINRQARVASTSFLVHPATCYVGLRLQQQFVRPKQPLTVHVAAANLDGLPVAASVTLRVYHRRHERKGWSWVEHEDLVKTLAVVTVDGPGHKEAPASIEVSLANGGAHWIEAEVVDGDGRRNFAIAAVYVAGGGGSPPSRPGRTISADELQLLLPETPPAPGDDVHVTLQAPFGPGHGLLCATAKGLVATLPFSLSAEGIGEVTLGVKGWHCPGLFLEAIACGVAQRDATGSDGREGKAGEGAPPRPAFAMGDATLLIPSDFHKLDVRVTPSSVSVAPGSEVSVTIEVGVGSDFEPQSGVEVTLIAVSQPVPNQRRVQFSFRTAPATPLHGPPSQLTPSADALMAGFIWQVDEAVLSLPSYGRWTKPSSLFPSTRCRIRATTSSPQHTLARVAHTGCTREPSSLREIGPRSHVLPACQIRSHVLPAC